MPVLAGDDMRCGYRIAVQYHLRIARSARTEIHQHRLVNVRFHSFKFRRIFCYLGQEICPALAAAVSDELLFHSVVLFQRLLDMVRNVVLCGSDYILYVSRLETVGIVLFHELVCGGNENSADLHKSIRQEPKFIMPFQYSHYEIALLNAVCKHHVRNAAALLFQITIGEAVLLAGFVYPKYSRFVGLKSCKLVNYVVREVEIIFQIKLEAQKSAFVIKLFFHEPFVKIFH